MSGNDDRRGEDPVQSDGFNLTVSWLDDTAVVTVAGALDMLTSPRLAAAIESVLAHDPAAILIDLTPTDFLASAGMSALIRAHHAAAPTAVAVIADGPATSRPIKLMGVDELINLHSTLDAALRGEK